jgi:putative endonuclease
MREILSAGFTKRHGVNRLVCQEMFGDTGYAIYRETRLKKYKRGWTLNLIQRDNVERRDLGETFSA